MNLNRINLFVRVLLLLFLLAAIALSILPVRRAALALSYPYQIDSVEGFLLKSSLDVAHGRPCYTDFQREPFLLCNYPPFYAVINALPFLFGAPPMFIFGRALNLASALGILLLLFAAVHARSKDILLSLIAPFVFLISFELYVCMPLYRVDLVGLLLSFAGIAILVRNDDRLNYRAPLLLFVLSFFTKQTELVAPLAYFLFLLVRNPRAAFRFALAFAAIAAAITYLLIVLTDGLYYQNTIYANANQMYLILVKIFLRDYWLRSAFFLIAVALCLFYYVFRRNVASESRKFFTRLDLSTFYLGASLLHFLALGKTGAFVNYLLEPTLAACLFLGLRLAELVRVPSGTKRPPLSTIAAAAVAVLLLLHAWRTATFNRAAAWARLPDAAADRAAARIIFDNIERYPGSIVSDVPIFTLLSHQRVVFNPFCSILAAEGKWDERSFLAAIRARKFSLIITTYDLSKPWSFTLLFTPAMATAVQDDYRKVAEAQFSTGGTVYIFVRNSNSVSTKRP